jgi:signal transduction histidine kinase
MSVSAVGQNNFQIDSLINVLEGASDEKKIDIYKTLCWDNRYSSPSKAFEFGQKALEIAIRTENKIEEASLYNYMGIIKRNQYDYPEALNYFYQALNLSEEIDSKVEIGYALNNIGDIHNRKNEDSLAFSYFKKACKNFTIIKNDKGLAYCFTQISKLFEKNEEYDSALNYNYEALKIKKSINDMEGVANSYRNIGNIHLENDSFELARKLFLMALEIDSTLNNPASMINDYYLLGKLSNRLKLFKDAVKYLDLAKEEVDNVETKLIFKDTYRELSFAYKEMRDFKKAYENYVVFKELDDELRNEEKFKSQIQLSMQFEFDKEQEQKEIIANAIKRRQTIIRYLLISIILVVLIILSIIYKAYQLIHQSNRKLSAQNEIIIKQRNKLEEANNQLIISESVIKKSNDTKDKFFSIIAHDLKAPFTSIIGYSNLLNNKYEEYDDERRKEFIKNVNTAAKNTFNLLQNLLEWARSQLDVMELKPVKQNINDLVNENIILLQNSANEKSISVSIDNEPNAVVNIDVNMINTVIRNLFSNAIKFTYPEGKIKILTRIRDKKVYVSVEDNGVGIKDKDIEKLFRIDRHFRSDGTKNEKGTGLGLILTKEFIDKNGGELFVKSKEGEGSTFSFSLPLYGVDEDVEEE